MYIGKNLPHAKREAQDRATRQGRRWYVFGCSMAGYCIESELRKGGAGMAPDPPVATAVPQGFGGPEMCKCGHNGYQHHQGGKCTGGHSLCRCSEFRPLKGETR